MKLMLRTSIVSAFTALVTTLGACGSAPKPAPAPEPPPVEVVPEKPLLTLPGESVPEAYQRPLSDFLEQDMSKIFQRVLEVSEVSNAISIVLERKIEQGGECRIGPTTVEIITENGATNTNATHFGEDCCPGTTCAMLPTSWNLRYINAVKSKDLAALAQLFPNKKKVAYSLVTPEAKSKKSWSRKDIAAGKFVNPPTCGFIDTRPACGEPDAKGAFQCQCDGGGYHVTYDWAKEGDTFVIVKIDESSS